MSSLSLSSGLSLTAIAAGSPALQAIDPSQAKTDSTPTAAAPPPSPNPLGRVNGSPVSGNRQPPGIPQSPYPVQPGYPYPYPPAGYQYPPGYYPPPQGYAYPPAYGAPQGYPGYAPQGYPAGYPPQGYPPAYQQPGGAYPPQGYPPAYPQGAAPPQGYAAPPGYAPGGYPPQGYAPPQGGYPPQGAGAPQGYPPAQGYQQPSQGYPAARPVYPTSQAARPPSGYPNENMIPDFNGRSLPAVPARPPGSPAMPPGGQGWATNVQAPAQGSSDEDRVMKLEQTAFGSTYPEHEVEDRVDHLEKEVLGGKSEGSMSDRISKLEAKLGGAGAFGHTNTPPQSGRGSRSSSTGSEPVIADAPLSQPADGSGLPAQPSAVPFPAAQAESEQPLAAVAQALGSQSGSGGSADTNGSGEHADSGAHGGPSAHSGPVHTQPHSQSAPIPVPPHASSANSQHSKPKTATESVKRSAAPLKKIAELPVSGSAPSSAGSSVPVVGSSEQPAGPSEQPAGLGSANVMGAPQMGSPENANPNGLVASAIEPPAKGTHTSVKGARAPDKSKLRPAKNAGGKSTNAVNPPEVQAVIDTIPSDPKAGDYFFAVKKFDGNTVARWISFPITIKLPAESPESWKKNLQLGINEWNRYIPLQPVADSAQSCDVEVTWVNKLLPGVLGITRLTTPKKGNIHVEIWMLRPTFYQPEIPEHALQVAFLHELGHAVGIFGHSNGQDDLMAGAELSLAMKGKAVPKSLSVEPKDLNTLREIYNSPAIPGSFELSQPLEWSGR
ncbi:MAG TPA: hypothetical protein V6C89_20405 [Drouetiella sp.]